jgi:DNA-binding NarL/FixJ family response regulator
MIRLFIIEDHHTIIVSGFKRLFFPARDGIEVACFRSTVEEAIEQVDADSFDLIILDLWLENKLPADNLRNLRDHFPGKPVVIYTSESAFAWRQKMRDEGASAYITKNASRLEILTAIQKAVNGEVYFPLNLDEVPIIKGQGPATIKGSNELTPVQKEILILLSKGLRHKEIAESINLSGSNVEKTLKRLRKTYDVKNNLELITYLTENGKL